MKVGPTPQQPHRIHIPYMFGHLFVPMTRCATGEILETDSSIITTRIMGSSEAGTSLQRPNPSTVHFCDICAGPAVGSSGAAGLPGLSELQSTTVQQVLRGLRESLGKCDTCVRRGRRRRRRLLARCSSKQVFRFCLGLPAWRRQQQPSKKTVRKKCSQFG
jgi:hypothetical protein